MGIKTGFVEVSAYTTHPNCRISARLQLSTHTHPLNPWPRPNYTNGYSAPCSSVRYLKINSLQCKLFLRKDVFKKGAYLHPKCHSCSLKFHRSIIMSCKAQKTKDCYSSLIIHGCIILKILGLSVK